MSQAFVLCADDYGHTAPVSRAILDLAAQGRLSALSCMTTSPLWPEHARWLKDVEGRVDIGLHITLVDETPLTTMPRTAPKGRLPDIKTLILKSYLGQLNLEEIAGEIDAQEQAFTSALGFTPQHLDGHLHTHVLPGIRDIVLMTAHRLAARGAAGPWLRNIHDRLPAIMGRGVAVAKAAFLSSLGRRLARAPHTALMNDSFSGVYDFSARRDSYGALFPHFLNNMQGRHVILCHPGEAGDTAAHTALRAGEYAFLKSAAFADLLARRGLRLGRFAEILP